MNNTRQNQVVSPLSGNNYNTNPKYASSMTPNYADMCMDIYKKNEIYYDVCDLIEVQNIIEPIDTGSRRVSLTTINNKSQRKEFTISFECLTRQDGAYSELNKQGFLLSSPGFATHLTSFISTKCRELMENGNISYTHNVIGWGTVKDCPHPVFFLDNVIGSKLNSKSDRKLSFKSGNPKDYFEFIEKTILPSVPLQTAFACGLTSVVCSLIKDYTSVDVILLDIVGVSSTGKSTVQHLITSLFSDAKISNNNLYRTFNGTYNSFMSANENIQGVPIAIDDSSSKENSINWENFVYQMVAGESKSRCENDGSLQKKEKTSWSGMIVVSSERSLLENFNAKQGATARLLVAENVQWTKTAQESIDVKSFVKECYGHVGPKYVKGLIEEIKKNTDAKFLIEMFDKEFKTIKSKLIVADHLSDRVCSQIAMIGITCDLIEKILGYKLKKDEILNIFISREQKQVPERNISEQAFEYILGKINENYNKFAVTKGEIPYGCIGSRTPFAEYWEICIIRDKVDEWLKKEFTEIKAIYNGWKDAKRIRHDADKNTIKSNFLPGRPRVVCFKILDKENEEKSQAKVEAVICENPPKSQVSFDDSAEVDALFEED